MSDRDLVGPAPSRPSASANASHADELARIRAMTALERMALALELGRRCRAVAEAARGSGTTEP